MAQNRWEYPLWICDVLAWAGAVHTKSAESICISVANTSEEHFDSDFVMFWNSDDDFFNSCWVRHVMEFTYREEIFPPMRLLRGR